MEIYLNTTYLVIEAFATQYNGLGQRMRDARQEDIILHDEQNITTQCNSKQCEQTTVYINNRAPNSRENIPPHTRWKALLTTVLL